MPRASNRYLSPRHKDRGSVNTTFMLRPVCRLVTVATLPNGTIPCGPAMFFGIAAVIFVRSNGNRFHDIGLPGDKS